MAIVLVSAKAFDPSYEVDGAINALDRLLRIRLPDSISISATEDDKLEG
jgi:hypothetical protein